MNEINANYGITYYEGNIDGADFITLSQSGARGSRIEIKHFGLGVLQKLPIVRKLDELLPSVFSVARRQWMA